MNLRTTEMSKIEFILITIKIFIWGNQGHWAHLCINPNNLWRVISLCLQALDNRNFRESGTNSNRRIFREIHPTLLKKIYSTSRKMFISWTSSWSPSGDLFNFYTILKNFIFQGIIVKSIFFINKGLNFQNLKVFATKFWKFEKMFGKFWQSREQGWFPSSCVYPRLEPGGLNSSPAVFRSKNFKTLEKKSY